MDQATFRKHKAALTRAKKVGPEKVIEVCIKALDDFQDNGFPDSWMNWQRALEDAQLEISRKNWSNSWV